ncbi:MAG: hypothetical protein FWH22_07715, partial [Fibromonadales bacterium]|nr:hypothetical protein [Fibromonadales bacterium]
MTSRAKFVFFTSLLTVLFFTATWVQAQCEVSSQLSTVCPGVTSLDQINWNQYPSSPVPAGCYYITGIDHINTASGGWSLNGTQISGNCYGCQNSVSLIDGGYYIYHPNNMTDYGRNVTLGAKPACAAEQPLSGTPIITGATGSFDNPLVYDELTANITGSNSEGPFTYNWEKCDATEANCVSTGVAISTYTVGASDVGSTIKVIISATNPLFTGSVDAVTNVVQLRPFASGVEAVISGSVLVGQTLTASLTGTDAPATGLSYTWKRYNADGSVANDDIGTDETYIVTENEDASYRIAVEIGAIGYEGAKESSLTDVVPYLALTGTAAIDNINPRIGSQLVASLAEGNNSGTLNYEWKADGSVVGGNLNYYEPTLDDLGKAIMVTITSNHQTGPIASAATNPVLKKLGAAPDAPANADNGATVEYNSVTLAVPSDTGDERVYEYARNTANETPVAGWQLSPYFPGLDYSADYYFFQRVQENSDTELTPASTGTLIRIGEEPADLLKGTAVIIGYAASPRIGDNLSVDFTPEEGGVTLNVWQWKLNNAYIDGATSENYTVKLEDLGGLISVEVRADGKSGLQVSEQIGPVLKTINLGTPSTPGISLNTHNTVTLNSLGENYQYAWSLTTNAPAADSDIWQSELVFDGLQPLQTYYFFSRIAGDETTDPSDVSSPSLAVTMFAAPFAGTVNISNTLPRIGNTLTAEFVSSNPYPVGHLTYTWKIGEKTVEDQSSYEVVEADLNAIITVEVVSEYQSGGPVSAATAAVGKQLIAAPLVPAIGTVTYESVALDVSELPSPPSGAVYEFAINAMSSEPVSGWQTSNEFTGLEPGTVYYFFQRIAEGTYNEISPASVGQSATTAKAPRAPPAALALSDVTTTHASISINSPDLDVYQYGWSEVGGSINWIFGSDIGDLTFGTEYIVYRRYIENAQYFESQESEGLSVELSSNLADPVYIYAISGSGNTTTATRSAPSSWTSPQGNIQSVIDDIRNNAESNPVSINFGTYSPPNQTNDAIIFRNIAGNPNWGDIRILGTISANYNDHRIIRIEDGVSIDSRISYTDNWNDGRARLLYKTGSGLVTVTSGNTSHAVLVYNDGPATVVIPSGSTLARTSGNSDAFAIYNNANGTVIV